MNTRDAALARNQGVEVGRTVTNRLALAARNLRERRAPAHWRPTPWRPLDSAQVPAAGGSLRQADRALLSEACAVIRVTGSPIRQLPALARLVRLHEVDPRPELHLEVRAGALRVAPGSSKWSLAAPRSTAPVLDQAAAEEVAAELLRRVLGLVVLEPTDR